MKNNKFLIINYYISNNSVELFKHARFASLQKICLHNKTKGNLIRLQCEKIVRKLKIEILYKK